jgi:hypothetical protein
METLGKFCKKVDRICADLNVFLFIVAIGLSILVTTMWVTRMVITDLDRARQSGQGRFNRTHEMVPPAGVEPAPNPASKAGALSTELRRQTLC